MILSPRISETTFNALNTMRLMALTEREHDVAIKSLLECRGLNVTLMISLRPFNVLVASAQRK